MDCNTKASRDIDQEVAEIRGEIGGLSRVPGKAKELEEARQRLAEAKINARIRKFIAEAPTFTEQQIAIIRGAFNACGGK